MKPTPWEIYRDAHISVCEVCRANGDRLSVSHFKSVQRAWREFQAKQKFIERNRRRKDEAEANAIRDPNEGPR